MAPAYTQNEALSNATSGNKNLNFFSKSGALRNESEERVINLFSQAFKENKLNALKLLFYCRDIRGGQGERRTTRIILKWLAENHPKYIRENMEYVSHFGRWDDLMSFFDTQCESDAVDLIKDQLADDIDNESVSSLLGKWLPSINASSKTTISNGHKARRALGMSEKEYRKMLSTLRKKIKIVEHDMCANRWPFIDYKKVPSKAMHKYRKAFDKHDSTRWHKYLEDVLSGRTTINSATLYPYDIVRSARGLIYRSNTNEVKALDAQWKNLPDYLKDNPHNGIVVADVSGSMLSGATISPMDICISLAMYFAERNNSAFKNKFITFSDNPKVQSISGSTIVEKVNNLQTAEWGMSTNIQAVFDTILATAKKYNIVESDMIDTIYIISDMQFDQATNHAHTNHKNIVDKYAKAGYKLPKLVYWNVNAVGGDYPIKVSDTNTCMVSGASPSILKALLSSTIITPKDVMMEVINDLRYDCIDLPV